MEKMVADLQVTRLIPLDGEGPVKAFCDLAVGEQLLIRGLRVVEGKQGRFVSMPRQQGKDGKWYDTVRLLTTDAKAAVERTVLEAYAAHDSAGPRAAAG